MSYTYVKRVVSDLRRPITEPSILAGFVDPVFEVIPLGTNLTIISISIFSHYEHTVHEQFFYVATSFDPKLRSSSTMVQELLYHGLMMTRF
jgi:hypothetical protein